MATCADFQKELDEQRGDFAGFISRANQSISRGSGSLPTDIGSLSSIANALNVDAGQVDLLVSYLTQFIEQATRAGCKAQADQAKSLLAQFQSLQQRITPLAAKVNTAFRQAQAATKQSTESTNNSGTGDPGTAGKGKDASTTPISIPGAIETTQPGDTLPEFTILARRANETKLQPGSDPNADEPLEEFTVQGNRIQDRPLTVSEPNLIDFGVVDVDAPQINIDPADELEEVTITAKRPNSTTGATSNARNQATQRESTNFKARNDWRVRLALAPGSTYLYNDSSNELLLPLQTTNGVIFPYTPGIQVYYGANYQSSEPTHSNYKFYQYENSYVDNISIGCEFTAQDTEEARYLLAVIHFFRSATKMFYGQDQNPKPGTPPPMCFLYGLGEFQFNAHPLAITGFNYALPTDVDYIRAGTGPTPSSDGLQEVTITGKRYAAASTPKPVIKKGRGQALQDQIEGRLSQGIAAIGNAIGLKLTPGGALNPPTWVQSGFKPSGFNQEENPTYVPTKIALQITCVPIMSRYETSNVFSLKDYANGNLIRGYGKQGRKGAGHW